MGAGTAYIGLGSNLGRRTDNLRAALARLGRVDEVKITAVSGIYETSPISTEGGYFLNAVARVETSLDPVQLLGELLGAESELGRTRRRGGKDARKIDIDLLLYDDAVVREKDLILPHPRMLHRRFVMEPLSEIEPDVAIPPAGITASEAAARLEKSCPDQEIRRLGTLDELRFNKD